jgi:hypothetical protein
VSAACCLLGSLTEASFKYIRDFSILLNLLAFQSINRKDVEAQLTHEDHLNSTLLKYHFSI